MKTKTKVTMFVIGIATLITGVIIARKQKKAKEESMARESRQEESQPKDENIIMFSVSERSIEVVRMPSQKEIRPREIGRLKNLTDYARLQSFNSKKNAEVYKNSNLSIEDLRSIWEKALKESINSDKIYSFVQEEYIQKVKKVTEQTSEVLERE